MPSREVAQPKTKDLVDRINETKVMLPFFLGGRIADMSSTIYLVSQIGIENERNLLLRELMRQNGPLIGNLIHSSLTVPILMLAAHGLNKLSDRFQLKFKAGNWAIYGLIGAEMYSIAAQNLIFNYFK
ncbi:MAG TPA: hypothetical protein VJG90_02085 [Candidatus Nanoarchaeia archaeon]|nr:hypothetical protein [Candidatus Nanoarchaeia archaeon]